MEEIDFLEMTKRQRDLIWHVCSDYRLSAAWTVEDAFQEVLAVLWRDWRKFEGRSAESHWVWCVATNVMLGLKRKIGNQAQPEAPRAEEAADDDADFQYLRQLIDLLDDKDAFIVRAHLDGFKNKEIAEMLKLPVTTATKRLSRAIDKMRRYHERRF